MDAIIGKYRVQMEETGLVIKHPTGLSFDLLPDEVIGLGNFIDCYRESLVELQRDTEPRLKAIDTEAVYDHNKRWTDKQS